MTSPAAAPFCRCLCLSPHYHLMSYKTSHLEDLAKGFFRQILHAFSSSLSRLLWNLKILVSLWIKFEGLNFWYFVKITLQNCIFFTKRAIVKLCWSYHHGIFTCLNCWTFVGVRQKPELLSGYFIDFKLGLFTSLSGQRQELLPNMEQIVQNQVVFLTRFVTSS